MKKAVCIVTGTRAEYGLLRPLIDRLHRDPCFELRLVATGSHLSSAFGGTWREIELDGYPIHAKIKLPLDSDTHAGMARATGAAITAFTDYFDGSRPEMLVLLGDRFELLAAAIAASMLHIPIAHLCGGDTSEGAVDEFIRHSITKMSYLHFPTNEESAWRVIQLGEDPARVFNVGALSVENIVTRPLLSREELSLSLGFDIRQDDYALVTYHSVTMDDGADEIDAVLSAVGQFPRLKFIFTKANADAGGRSINAKLDEFAKSHKNCAVFASLGNLRYLSAMKYAAAVIGNSSSGLYETPSFGVPVVNIGDRQRGRMRAENVIDCTPETDAIVNAVATALSDAFKETARKTVSPFGDGTTSEKIVNQLRAALEGGIDLKKTFYKLPSP